MMTSVPPLSIWQVVFRKVREVNRVHVGWAFSQQIPFLLGLKKSFRAWKLH